MRNKDEQTKKSPPQTDLSMNFCLVTKKPVGAVRPVFRHTPVYHTF